MFIVSANYRNRKSKNRWLMRSAEQKPKEAKALTSVAATEIRFKKSKAEELGFGCYMIAEAQTVEVSKAVDNDIRVGEVKLLFCLVSQRAWFQTVDGVKVDSCVSLRLTPNGSMYAVLANSQTETTEKEAKSA